MVEFEKAGFRWFVARGVRFSELRGGMQASDLLPSQFTPTPWDRWRWKHGMSRVSGRRTLELLKQLETERRQVILVAGVGLVNHYWLLKHRSDLRWAIRFSQLEPIKLYLADCPPEMVYPGVWLWGKCADRFRLYGLSAFCHHPSPKVRRCVAKALRRAEAWALLDEMAAANRQDPKIQWFATAAISHRPFGDRLKNFARNVDDSHAGEVFTPSRMPFWALERSWERTPPKSRAFIRRMLWRIRHCVRWGVS